MQSRASLQRHFIEFVFEETCDELGLGVPIGRPLVVI